MVRPRKVAETTMTDYFAAKGQRWPAVEATELLTQIRVGPDHRWTDRKLLDRAAAILSRAAFAADDLIENHLKISVSYESLAYLDKAEGSMVYGCAYPQTREIVICERVMAYEPLFRTTGVHELGHVLMHNEPHQRCLLYTPERLASTPEEREANAFMKAVILPDSVLRLAICYICGIWGIDTRLVFNAANSLRGRWIWRNRLFASLINKLCVSREMIIISMTQQRVFSADTVAYHKTYALQTKWHTPIPIEAVNRPLQRVMSEQRRRTARIETSTLEAVPYSGSGY